MSSDASSSLASAVASIFAWAFSFFARALSSVGTFWLLENCLVRHLECLPLWYPLCHSQFFVISLFSFLCSTSLGLFTSVKLVFWLKWHGTVVLSSGTFESAGRLCLMCSMLANYELSHHDNCHGFDKEPLCWMLNPILNYWKSLVWRYLFYQY